MRRDPATLSGEVFDLLVIGGGIFGAGVARDAALRGLRVALVEQGDFASGASSQSSKLIHGGFRYLEQYNFALVAESSRERRILTQIAPHRVKPLPLLLPVYRRDKRALWMLRIGMTLYDVLAMYRNFAAHRALSAPAALELEPTLRPDDLLGAIRFYDCQEDDARFCIDNILHASALGCVCVNYCGVTSFKAADGKVAEAIARDRLTGNLFSVKARVFINAAGAWVERVAAMAQGLGGPPPHLSPTKGVHILLPRLTRGHGIFFQGRQDSRMMFALPWNDCTLIGTTDTEYAGDPTAAAPDRADIEYLLHEARWLFSRPELSSGEVLSAFAGIRPLLASDASDPSARSREHRILRQGANFLSLAGGKYTTYRLIARQAVDEALALLGRKSIACRTDVTPLPDFRPAPTGRKLADAPEVFESDIVNAVQNEMAVTIDDVLRRRTGLSLSRFNTKPVMNEVRTIASAAGWQAADLPEDR